MGDFEELHRAMQVAVNSVVPNVNKKVQALSTFEAAQEEQLKVCRAEMEAYKG